MELRKLSKSKMVPMKGLEGASLPCPYDKAEESGERKEIMTDICVQKVHVDSRNGIEL